MTHGLTLACTGVLLGLLGSQLASGVLKTVLFRTAPTDVAPAVYAVGLLIGAAALACFAPARRASRVAPIEGLKEN